jgi:hypothetical protein
LTNHDVLAFHTGHALLKKQMQMVHRQRRSKQTRSKARPHSSAIALEKPQNLVPASAQGCPQSVEAKK